MPDRETSQGGPSNGETRCAEIADAKLSPAPGENKRELEKTGKSSVYGR
jgi:hypothetical protein